MENSNINFFYGGIAYGAYEKDNHKLKREGLPIRKLGKELPYLFGEKRDNLGKIQIYYALLPEYGGKKRFSGKYKAWKPEMAWKLLERAEEKAALTLGCREQIWACELNQNLNQIPQELMAACLYRHRPFDRICISLPDECREYDVQEVIELLNPYLARMHQVLFWGDESEASLMFEDYLYGEYGIVMTRAMSVPLEMLWLDLSGRMERQASLKSLRYINRLETLKFLDTAVKNGYNTEVN